MTLCLSVFDCMNTFGMGNSGCMLDLSIIAKQQTNDLVGSMLVAFLRLHWPFQRNVTKSTHVLWKRFLSHAIVKLNKCCCWSDAVYVADNYDRLYIANGFCILIMLQYSGCGFDLTNVTIRYCKNQFLTCLKAVNFVSKVNCQSVLEFWLVVHTDIKAAVSIMLTICHVCVVYAAPCGTIGYEIMSSVNKFN